MESTQARRHELMEVVVRKIGLHVEGSGGHIKRCYFKQRAVYSTYMFICNRVKQFKLTHEPQLETLLDGNVYSKSYYSTRLLYY
jgi:hypothetical protein